MVELSPGDAVLLALLLACVPVQLWLVHHNTSTSDTRDGRTIALFREIHKSFQKYVSPHYWSSMLLHSYAAITNDNIDPLILEYSRLSYEQLKTYPEEDGECPAVEVIRMKNPEGHYAASPHQRRYRTHVVQYRVGQVVRHTKYGIKGVVIGWDDTCQAPEEFIKEAYDPAIVPEVCELPNYTVLIDTRDFPQGLTQYIAQKDLEPLTNTKVHHPLVDRFFTVFDGSRYLLQGWLAAIYPED